MVSTKPSEHVENILYHHIQQALRDLEEPWILQHALLVEGLDFQISDQRRVTDYLVQEFGTWNDTLYLFPPKTKDGKPLSPHPGAISYTFLTLGLPLDTLFKTSPGKHLPKISFLQLLKDELHQLKNLSGTKINWNKHAWHLASLVILEQQSLPQLADLTSKSDRHNLYEHATKQLTQDTNFFAPLMQQNTPEKLIKRKQGIYAYSCGGMHFLQSILRYQSKQSVAYAVHQLHILKFRWNAEKQLYQRTLKQQSRYGLLILLQELKFFGHLLETLGLAYEWGLPVLDIFSPSELKDIQKALTNTVETLKPLFKKQDQLKQKAPQQYYDLIGDSCHAINGLRKVGKMLQNQL